MRLPNQFGSISKLSGNRRKPYVVRKSAVSFNGKRKLLYLGTFETYDKAIQFLSEYNKEDKPQVKTIIQAFCVLEHVLIILLD